MALGHHMLLDVAMSSSIRITTNTQASKGIRGSRMATKPTNREFLRHEMTSEGSVVAICGWVVLAEAS